MTEELPRAEVSDCAWCGAPVEGAGEVYCCHGCEAAAGIVSAAGLERFLEEREAPSPRPGPRSRGWDRVETREAEDGERLATLRIDGLRCSSCVWVTERVLQGTEGVTSAQVSYADGRTQLRFDPKVVDLPALAERIEALGYRPRPADAARNADPDLLLRLGVAAFAAVNVMTLSAGVYLGWWAGMEARFATLFRFANLVLATPVALWAAAPFFQAAWNGLRARVLHMDLPVSLGVAVLYGHGLIATFLGQDAYLDSLCMLVALLLAGRLLDQRGRGHAAEAAASLAAHAPQVVRRLGLEGPEECAPEELAEGDVIEVAAGEEIGADGHVVWGEGQARMALVTGESEPAPLKPGTAAYAGAVLLSGAVHVEVERAGGQTLLARMAEGLEQSSARPSKPTPADRLAPWFTGSTLGLAILTFAGWSLRLGVDAAIPPTIAVLVVACPCALALSAPLARAAGLGAAARRGLLLRSGDALDRLAEVDLIALDKTGTLTQGEPVVVQASDEALRVASGLERNSVHPIARAIVNEAGRRGLPIPLAEQVQEVPGVGISGVVHGSPWRISRGGPGEVLLESEGRPTERIVLTDQLRADAAATLRRLGRRAELVLLTGDRREVADRIAAELGGVEVVAELTPDGKLAWIREAQARGRRVLFVGDGLNDGPALAAADAAVAMGSGAASSVLVADAVVATDAVGPLLAGLAAAGAAQEAMRLNLRRSLVYNVAAIAAGVLGFVNPLVAAVLMPLSSGLVLAGSLGVERRTRQELSR
ncbi:MAG: cadmium-translocating P-type ATPase [Alphaproteobacteria bacterium]|nr:cadmium-translocating P-type ATPase [Alphaproteobacteria bacterium]